MTLSDPKGLCPLGDSSSPYGHREQRGRTRGKPLAKPPGVSHIINVYINYEKAESFNVNNIIARAGGPWENVPCADENHDFIAGKGIPPRKGIPDHAWADEMFSDLVKIHVEALR